MALPSTGPTVFLTFCFNFVSLRIDSYLLPYKNIPLFYSIIMICYFLFLFVPIFYYFSFLRSSVLDPDPGPYVFGSADPDPCITKQKK
jgi:hypothetical protein